MSEINNKPAQQIAKAKNDCEEKILKAVSEFHDITGLEVDDLRFNKGYLEHKYDDFDVIHPTTITIVVSL